MDWLDLTLRPGEVWDPVQTWMAYGLGPASRGPGDRHYADAIRADVSGARLLYNGRGDARGTALLTLPGDYWSGVPDPNATLARLVVGTDGSSSRCDLASDFVGAVPDLRAIAAAFEEGRARTRLRRGRYMRDLSTGGETVYLGSPASDRMLRVYNMRGPTRVEGQTRNAQAQDLVSSILERGPWEAWRALVASLVDFPGLGAWRALLAAPGPS